MLCLSGAFWGRFADILWSFGRPFSTRKCRCMCRVAIISLHLAFFLACFTAVLGKKKAGFGPKLQILKRRSGRHLQCPFPSAIVEYPAHSLCGCPSHPQLASTKVLAQSQAPRRSCDFCPFCACLQLAACLLAACMVLAKSIGSTLDTKEGHKTKSGSTSSVTLALTLTRAPTPTLTPVQD